METAHTLTTQSVIKIILIVLLEFAFIYGASNFGAFYFFLPAVVLLLVIFSMGSSMQWQYYNCKFTWLITALFIWLLLVGLWCQMANFHYYRYGELLPWVLGFWLMTFANDLQQQWRWLMTALVVIILSSCVISLVNYLLLHRVFYGGFHDKNTLAAVINLLLFPLISYSFIFDKKRQKLVVIFSIIVFIASLALISSRGAICSAIIGLGLYVGLTYKKLAKKWLLLMLALLLVLIVVALMFGVYAHTKASLLSLLHPMQAGANRFVLWRPAWQLIKQHPWFGIGLGNFAWYLPAIRSAIDPSLGMYVHNDYLQFWLEGGLPAVLLLIASIVALIHLVWRANNQHKLEISGLFVGIITVFIHSLFTFNLYVSALVFPLGLCCARLCYLASQQKQINLQKYFRKGFYIAGLATIALVIFIYYSATTATLYLTQRGQQAVINKKFHAAEHYFNLANYLQPNRMMLLVAQAKLYVYLDQHLSAKQGLAKFVFYMKLKPIFTALEKHYPLNNYQYLLQNSYYLRNRGFAGKHSYCLIKHNYLRAVQLVPLDNTNWYLYSRFLAKYGNKNCPNKSA